MRIDQASFIYMIHIYPYVYILNILKKEAISNERLEENQEASVKKILGQF